MYLSWVVVCWGQFVFFVIWFLPYVEYCCSSILSPLGVTDSQGNSYGGSGNLVLLSMSSLLTTRRFRPCWGGYKSLESDFASSLSPGLQLWKSSSCPALLRREQFQRWKRKRIRILLEGDSPQRILILSWKEDASKCSLSDCGALKTELPVIAWRFFDLQYAMVLIIHCDSRTVVESGELAKVWAKKNWKRTKVTGSLLCCVYLHYGHGSTLG